jgi:hypothetical protein
MAMGRLFAANEAMSAIRSRTGRVRRCSTAEPGSVGLTHSSPAGSSLWHVMGASASGRGCKRPFPKWGGIMPSGEEAGSDCDTNQISS